MRDPKHPRQFTEEFRRQIVALVDSGKPRAEVMREYDLGKSTLDRWIRRVHACGSTAAADNRTPEQNRLIELVRGRAFASEERLRTELFDWVNWCNNCRLHSTLGYMTPAGFREAGLILS